MKKRKKEEDKNVLVLSNIEIIDWVRDDLMALGVNEPEVVAFALKPDRHIPFIIIGKNPDNTVRGFEYNPELLDDPPMQRLDGLPQIARVEPNRISNDPKQRVYL